MIYYVFSVYMFFICGLIISPYTGYRGPVWDPHFFSGSEFAHLGAVRIQSETPLILTRNPEGRWMDPKNRMALIIWVVVSNIFYFHPYLGKIPIWLIFFKGVETTN